MKKVIFSIMLFFVSFSITSCDEVGPIVTITKQKTHFRVVINVNNASHREVGAAYAKALLKAVPDIEAMIDSYQTEMVSYGDSPYYPDFYQEALRRVEEIKPQIHNDYIEELEGIASVFSGGDVDVKGDNKVSRNEVYLYHLAGEVIRPSACSAVSVFGELSETGKSIVGKNLDWYVGKDKQLARSHAITTIIDGDKTICFIGFLGALYFSRGFNNDKIFGGWLDSQTGQYFSSSNKRSLGFDLRYAMENYSTAEDIANYLIDPANEYVLGHLFFLSDPDKSMVVENDLSSNQNRRIRYSGSSLSANVQPWPENLKMNTIGAVNSFVLDGAVDNHHYDLFFNQKIYYNTARWSSMVSMFDFVSRDNVITRDDIKKIISYDGDDGYPGYSSEGDLYHSLTLQQVIFEPDSYKLEVYFIPETGILDKDPVYETIEVDFQD